MRVSKAVVSILSSKCFEDQTELGLNLAPLLWSIYRGDGGIAENSFSIMGERFALADDLFHPSFTTHLLYCLVELPHHSELSLYPV